MPPLIAILGPTATGKSALGIAIAERFNGEIINCDSTAVYRGFDIGTDKVPFAERRGIPHHLIDIADPTDEYTAAQFARDAAAVIARPPRAREAADPGRRHRLLLPRADARTVSRARARTPRCARGWKRSPRRKGVETLHRMVTRVDPESARADSAARSEAARPRARGVFPDRQAADRALRGHRVAARAGRHGWRDRAADAGAWLADRLARRVDEQFAAGLLDEIRALLAAGVPPGARPFGGLVYRQAMEHLRGVRDEASTRALIAQENRQYARRQLIWFRKEPNLVWFDGPGTNAEVQDSVIRELTARDLLKDGRHVADT